MTSPSTLPEPADQFITAIDNEIRAILADSATNKDKLPLKGGKRVQVGHGETPHAYLFSCTRWKDSFESDRLLVRPSRSKDPWDYATATAHPNGKVLVTTRTDLGGQPGNVQLREDDTHLLESLADRIRDSGQRPGPVNPTTAGWILGGGEPSVGRVTAPHRLISGYRDMPLNPGQRRAVEQALGSGITFVWGPPGTGKTEVVSLITEGSYRLGERVLFLAPTNVAVDQALERVCERLEGEEDFDSGLVQRAGDIEVASLRERFGSVIDPEMVVGRLGADLAAQAEEREGFLKTAGEQRAAHERLARAEAELAQARSLERETTDEASAREAEATRAQADLEQVAESIRLIGTPSGIFAKRKAERLATLVDRQERLGSTLGEALRHRDAATGRLGQIARTVSARVRERDAAHEATRGLPSPAVLDERIGQAERELEEVREKLDGLLEEVHSRCRVMGTTLAKALRSRNLMGDVDTVIIDEAGMVDLPSAWCAAGLAGKRVVVAGDFRQLPSITQGSDSKALGPEEKHHSRQWMDRDAFHAAGLVDSTGRVGDDPRLVSLDTQYRMRPDICSVVNEVAYPDAPLNTGRGDASRLPYSPLMDRAVVLVDTSARRVALKEWDKHQTNKVHEAVIHELVRGLQYDGVLTGRKHEEPGSPAELMAVISPYRKQVNHLRSSLKHRFGAEYEGLADTVHRFQGSQRPLVILDTVAGAGKKPGRFYEGSGLSSDTTRLLNVALSRAQDHLVVVADVEYLRQHLRPNSETVRLLATLERTAQRIPVEELVPVRSAGDLSGLSEDELRRPAFFPADEVERALSWDFEQAEKSIEIYSAYLNVAPVGRWLERLSRRIERGVRAIVYTRPPSDFEQSQGERQERLIRQMREKGCDVAVRPRMHEKVVVLDESVLWHGSLNLLASRGATDLMMRLTDPTACARVRRIVDNAYQDQPMSPRNRWQPSPGDEAHQGPVPEVGKVVNNRLYVNVPKHEKEMAKREVRAQWHKEVGLWWVRPDTPREKLTRWL
ncbi:hypothetical protein A6A08_05115 [Nocardiopsis sp. TSRI0078]|uniref:AAA domain-containing protein n=1 Tax=unclassified Nocardiopsis TaxID=2649073 RepID=UPI00093DC8AA|nr:AAA domain-containing protein [Nocardiopsis sp. TSRI0078]OKI18988.1 hypothetical protein A6A08_05115 [Nocardiopsis sp. TSRI0078]